MDLRHNCCHFLLLCARHLLSTRHTLFDLTLRIASIFLDEDIETL